MAPTNAPYGTWKSPLGADLLTQKSINISEVVVDHANNKIIHLEGRPFEKGRNVPVADGVDLVGEGWNARTAVHEYGGAAIAIHDNVLYFSDIASNRIHRSSKAGDTPVPVTPDNSNHRFGDFVVHPTKPNYLISILEDHTRPAPSEVETTLVIVDTDKQYVTTLAKGADFYAAPTISPDGQYVAWVQWNHPNMPWEASQVYFAKLSIQGDILSVDGEAKFVAGEGEQSVSQPAWASNTSLVFLYDISGYWNPWVYDLTKDSTRPILPKPVKEDYADPAWSLGETRYAVLNSTTLLTTPIRESVSTFALLDITSGQSKTIDSPYVYVGRLRAINEHEAVFTGLQSAEASALVHITLPDINAASPSPVAPIFKTLKQTSNLTSEFPASLFSHTQSISLPNPTPDTPLHILYHPPTNPEYAADGKGDGEKPPAIVSVHGGPTGRVPPGISWTCQYFTSRGWAWIDVNYGGSSGYGKAYRDRLRGNWGVVDVEDCATTVKQLGERGLIDPSRVAIRGGSAGGFTVLATLVQKPDVFTAGTSLYGVSDLAKLAEDTHKFESQYLFKLVGGTLEEVPEVYQARSPVHHAENITAPLLILQGSIDAVVPPNQAEVMEAKIKARGGKVKYVLFEGEGHGWRQSENIKRALELELDWYENVFQLGSSDKA